jgi:hypothetical protein
MHKDNPYRKEEILRRHKEISNHTQQENMRRDQQTRSQMDQQRNMNERQREIRNRNMNEKRIDSFED